MVVENIIDTAVNAFRDLYGQEPGRELFQIEKTNREFSGDYTLVVFPLLKYSRKPPPLTAAEVGSYLVDHLDEI
jgi:arginyl-tRNA synthetase